MKTKILLSLLVIVMLFSVNAHSQEQEIYLDQSELPAEWSIVGVVQFPKSIIDRLREGFGVEIKRYNEYIIQTEEEALQMQILQFNTESEAEMIFDKSLKEEDNKKLNFQKVGDKVIKYNSINDNIIEHAKEINLISDELTTFSKEYDEEIDYLSQNHVVIDFKEENSFELLDEDIKDKQVFLSGEGHGTAINYKLRFEFLKCFQEKAGVRYHLIEGSYAKANLLNRYLETGDKEILNRILLSSLDYFSVKEEYEFWQKVYQFNQSLSEDEQIKVVGTDVMAFFSNSIWYLYSLLPDKEPPNKIARSIQILEMMYEEELYNDREMVKNFITILNEDLEENYEKYKSYLGDKLFNFELVSEDVLIELERKEKTSLESANIREMRMYENFKKIYSQLPEGKVYGHFGSAHILQQSTTDREYRLGGLLNSVDSPVKDEVLSIYFSYQDSKVMGLGEKDWESTTGFPINLEEFAETDLTLFKLKGEDSPFEEKIYWASQPLGRAPSKGVTTDYYQYMLLIRNAEATTPFRDKKDK